ncbi:MAG: hypothetical protein HYZ00_01185, partial [Candidatus Hydrogenedentes bacterium]|nr:hypothetical protein [Candidatus Hydrogenedentota bacterium]
MQVLRVAAEDDPEGGKVRSFAYFCCVTSILMPAALGQTVHKVSFSVEPGSQNYLIESVSADDVYDGPLEEPDPSLNLIVGSRYEISVTSSSRHPFQVV